MNELPLSVRPRAQEEARKAARWYEDHTQGLGAAFLEVLDQTLVKIPENPSRYPAVYRDVRRALLKRFPYGVFFRVKPELIQVIAITHLSRNPAHWQRRV